MPTKPVTLYSVVDQTSNTLLGIMPLGTIDVLLQLHPAAQERVMEETRRGQICVLCMNDRHKYWNWIEITLYDPSAVRCVGDTS